MTLDDQGRPTVIGWTTSPDFPTTPGAWSSSPKGVFVTRLDASGSNLHWSTVFGGNGFEFSGALALDAAGGVVAVGRTNSADFPTTPGALEETHPGNAFAAFVVRLAPDGGSAVYSTFLPEGFFGNAVRTEAVDVGVDASGSATVTGSTWFGFMTTPGSYLPAPPGPGDSYVARLDPLGTRLLYSTFIGGPGSDGTLGITLSPTGTVTVGGATSGGYPVTPHAYDPTFNGGQTDGFLTSFDLLPRGVEQGGESVPACLGPLNAGVTEMPVAGAQSFGLTCSGAPPLAPGFLSVFDQSSLWIAGASSLSPGVRIATTSTLDGWAEATLPLPIGSKGFSFLASFAFRNTPACTGPSPWSRSNTLRVTVQ